MNQKSISWIHSMKGIAMCGVIMIHLGGASLPSILGRIGNIGRNGVQVFFLISAYLTFCSLYKIFGGTNVLQKKLTFEFLVPWWKKKFIKLIPLYYLMIIICFVIEGGNSYWLGTEKNISFFNILSHVLFIHGLFPHYTDSIIGVEWYLGVLAIFYFLAPILYKYINSLEKAIAVFVISIPICYGIKEIAYGYLPVVDDVYIYTSYIETFGIMAQLPVLFLGIVLFFVLLEFDVKKIKEKKIISYGLLCFSLMMILGQAYQKNTLYMINGITLFGLWFFCIALSQAIWNAPFIDNKIFRIIGEYSYPIYLIHFFLIHVLQKYWIFNIENVILNWLVQYIIILCTSMVIAYLIEKYYNKPIVCWLEKHLICKKE